MRDLNEGVKINWNVINMMCSTDNNWSRTHIHLVFYFTCVKWWCISWMIIRHPSAYFYNSYFVFVLISFTRPLMHIFIYHYIISQLEVVQGQQNQQNAKKKNKQIELFLTLHNTFGSMGAGWLQLSGYFCSGGHNSLPVWLFAYYHIRWSAWSMLSSGYLFIFLVNRHVCLSVSVCLSTNMNSTTQRIAKLPITY